MSRLYADIIVDISQEKLDRTFQYEIPEHLQDDIQIGTKVRVPFGNGGREITGYVIDITGQPKVEAVSYTHLDVYKRQVLIVSRNP